MGQTVIERRKKTKEKRRLRMRRVILESEYSKSNYVRKIENLIKSGILDKRYGGKKCPRCNKIMIRYEIEKHLNNNETYARHRFTRNYISWAALCIDCGKNNMKKWFIDCNSGKKHNTYMLNTLSRHIDGNRQILHNTLKLIRKRDGGKCRCCGISVVCDIKSGWMQESINDMHPNIEHSKKSEPINEIVITCVACNLFQNNLPWLQHIEALKIISTRPIIKNTLPLSDEEIQWIKKDGHGMSEIRLKVIERDGRHCRVTGVELIFKRGYWNTVSFDRIDSKLPYTLENTRLVCKHINFVKVRSITESELQDWLAHIRVMYCPPDNFFESVGRKYRKDLF